MASPITKKKIWNKSLLLATAGHFTNDFYNGFIPPLLPIVIVNLSLSLTSAGLLLSIFSISNSLLQPITGLIADRLKRNYFVLFGPVLAGGFMGFVGWINQYWTLLLILCMSGIGTAMFHPQAAAMVGKLKNNRLGLAMSIFNTSGALGVTVGSIVIIPLTSKFGMKSTIFTIVPVLLLFFYSYHSLLQEKEFYAHSVRFRQIIELIKSNILLLVNLYLIVVIRATLTLAFSGFIPQYLYSRGNSLFFAAVGLAVFQFFYVIGMLIGGFIFDLVGFKKLLIVSFLFVIPFSLPFLNLPSIWGFPFLALTGLFLSSSTPVNIILGQRIAPDNASFMSAVMMGLGWGIAGLLMTLIGAVADKIGLYWALTLVSFTSLFGLALVLLLDFDNKFSNAK